jgi:hypothetical protein
MQAMSGKSVAAMLAILAAVAIATIGAVVGLIWLAAKYL